jgi:hypothetical protein
VKIEGSSESRRLAREKVQDDEQMESTKGETVAEIRDLNKLAN